MSEDDASTDLRRPSPSNRCTTLAEERTGDWTSYNRYARRSASIVYKANVGSSKPTASSPIARSSELVSAPRHALCDSQKLGVILVLSWW
jgi:hypothetical protein